MIKIGYSCPEEVTSMPKSSCGHYCTVCTKDVYDFRGKTNSEVDSILKSDTSIQCGIFEPNQIQDEVKNEMGTIFRIAFAAIFILGFNMNALFAQAACDFPPDGTIKIKQITEESLKISGTVKSNDGSLLHSTHVSYSIGNTYYEASCDKSGRFVIDTDQKLLGKTITLIFSNPGMEQKSVTIKDIKDDHFRLDVTMEVRHYTRGVIAKPGMIIRE